MTARCGWFISPHGRGFDSGTLAIESPWLPPSTAEKRVPRFYFNIYDGITDLDHKGMELVGWSEARLEAIQRAGIIFKDKPKTFALGEEWRMEVTDENGLILFTLDFSVSLAPVLSEKSRQR